MSGSGPPLRGSEKQNNRLTITQSVGGSPGIQTQGLKVVCFVGLGMESRASYMLHKCSATGLQPHPGGKVFGEHSTRLHLSHSPWNNAGRTVRAGREESTHQHHETKGHNLLMYESLWKNKSSFDYTPAVKWHGQNSLIVPQISFRKDASSQ